MEEKNESKTQEEIKPELKHYIISIIIFVLIGFAIWHLIGGLFNTSTTGDSKDDKLEAYVMSQDFIKDYLTNPSSAKFPNYSSVNVIQTNNRYKVEAYVESKNNLGVMVKTQYYMVLEKANDGGWTKVSCTTK